MAFLGGASSTLLSIAALYAAYAWVAVEAVRGVITIGDMTMYLMLFRQGQTAVTTSLGAVGGMYEDNLYLSTLYEYLEQPVEASNGTAVSGPDPDAGVQFENVEFRYPGSDQIAITGVNLQIKRGNQYRNEGRCHEVPLRLLCLFRHWLRENHRVKVDSVVFAVIFRHAGPL